MPDTFLSMSNSSEAGKLAHTHTHIHPSRDTCTLRRGNSKPLPKNTYTGKYID